MANDRVFYWGDYNSAGVGNSVVFWAQPQLVANLGGGGLPTPLGPVTALTAEAGYCQWIVGGVPYGLGTNTDNGITQTATNPYTLQPQVSCATTDNGTFNWAALGTFVQVDSGDHWSWAVNTAGAVYAWGHNGNGALGQNNTTDSPIPLQVQGIGGTGFLALAAADGAVSGGGGHAVGLRTDATVVACGDNTFGELGDGTTTQRTTPVRVLKGAGPGTTFLSTIAQITTGQAHSVALDTSGNVWAWGQDQYGQLGDGNSGPGVQSPLPVAMLTPWSPATIAVVSAGGGGSVDGHTLMIDSTGKLWGCGNNDFGQIGDGTIGVDRSTPVAVLSPWAPATIVDASAGAHHSIAIDSNNILWTWGGNDSGELGIPYLGQGNQLTPVAVNRGPLGTLPAGTIHLIWAGNRCTTVYMSCTPEALPDATTTLSGCNFGLS